MAELRHNTTSFGTYTLTVSSVTRDGIAYDPGANVTSSAIVVLE